MFPRGWNSQDQRKESLTINKEVFDLLEESGLLGCTVAKIPIELNLKLHSKRRKKIKDNKHYKRLV